MIVSYFEEPPCCWSVYSDQPVGDVVETPGAGEVYTVQMDQLPVSSVNNLHCFGFTGERGRGSLSALPPLAAGQTPGQEAGVETGGATG